MWTIYFGCQTPFLAVGQGDAHIIECKISSGGQEEYEFAIVDMGTSSIKVLNY